MPTSRRAETLWGTPNWVEAYETWLRAQCRVVEKGLKKKHAKMAADPFQFFRATCFRFARATVALVPQLAGAPAVPSVGDAHIENWGTWRDAEGRLVWGVNDFDESAVLPFTYDLLRLATSARLAPGIPGTNRERAAAILAGYREGLDEPRPCLVEDAPVWLQACLTRPAVTPGTFRAKLDGLKPDQSSPEMAEALRRHLPEGTHDVRTAAWQRGGGSLGRPRYVAHGTWRGGLATREAKALVASAWDWVRDDPGRPSLFLTIAGGRYRAPDPFLTIKDGCIFRRIAPDSMKINLAASDASDYGAGLLSAMGADLAAIHAAGKSPIAIRQDLDRRDDDWLHRAARVAAAQVEDDYAIWSRHYHRAADIAHRAQRG